MSTEMMSYEVVMANGAANNSVLTLSYQQILIQYSDILALFVHPHPLKAFHLLVQFFCASITPLACVRLCWGQLSLFFVNTSLFVTN